jgi:uncharacterized protein DUF6444
MSDASTLPGIDAADWADTPQAARIPVLALSEQVGALEERTHGGSRNSTQPPSTDPPGTPGRPNRRPSSRKQGGQPGHAGHGPLLPRDLKGRG